MWIFLSKVRIKYFWGESMKEKLTITIESELLAVIERNMAKANYSNKSRFVEFALNEMFFNIERRLAFFENLMQKKARELGELSRYVHDLQLKADQHRREQEILDIPPKEKTEKDALWQE